MTHKGEKTSQTIPETFTKMKPFSAVALLFILNATHLIHPPPFQNHKRNHCCQLWYSHTQCAAAAEANHEKE